MKYILCNFYVPDNIMLENTLTNEIFKDSAYGAKIKNKETKMCIFNNVAIPLDEDINPLESDVDIIIGYCKSHTTVPAKLTDMDIRQYSSIYSMLKTITARYTFDIITIIDSSDCDIFYSDGSSTTKGEKAASYGMVKLTKASLNEEALYDDFSNKTYLYETFSDKIADGTNNIGELTGIKMAIENMGTHDVQVIISDSEYSLKCFREWIYNWKKNGYIASNRKKILNCELIQNIQASIETSKKIFLFKWTKGHVNTPFNELCDELAKAELGIEK